MSRGSARRPASTPPTAAAVVLVLAGLGCGDVHSRSGAASADVAPGETPAPAAAGSGAGAAIFADATATAGLDFRHRNGMRGDRWFVEMMGAGVALVDYDGDDDLDLFLVQGGSLDPEARGTEAGDRLYRNDLALGAAGATPRFVDVTAASGVIETGYGMGVATGDYDGDGWTDLYVTNWGPNELWRNRGDGSFERRGTKAGVDDAHWSVPAVFFDADRDGRLDLYVGNYVDFSEATHQRCMSALGVLDYCGPLAFTPQPDFLYRNAGDGTFTDVSGAAGLRAASPLPALGAVAGDFDADGWSDLYVANDQTPNYLWRGLGGGRFEEVALAAGCALDGEGRPQASMGVALGDGDGDGDEDLLVTHLTQEHHTLYLNDGRGVFEDASGRAGVVAPSFPLTGFGVGWIDFDGDGALDLLSTSGAVKLIPAQVAEGDPLALRQRGLLLRNSGGGRFAEVALPAGSPVGAETVGRGAAFGDVDNDGDTDVVVTANDGPARLLLNQVGSRASWVGLRLVERAPSGRDRDALGTWVAVRRAGAPALWRRVQTAGSYGSASDPRLLFGLAESDAIESVEVKWPDGTIERWGDLDVRRYHTLRRGEGR